MTEVLKRGYLTPLRVENLDAKNWSILEHFGWRGSYGDEFWVDPGDITDFASVPWWTQMILPRTGTWTKAAVLHDKMCDLQNKHYKSKKLHLQYDERVVIMATPKPVFDSIDTDAIFYKNARADGTDLIRSELLWFGVRCGALRNPARREGWLRTFPRWFADLGVIVATLYVLRVLLSLIG